MELHCIPTGAASEQLGSSPSQLAIVTPALRDGPIRPVVFGALQSLETDWDASG